jgi:hypothetical protein
LLSLPVIFILETIIAFDERIVFMTETAPQTPPRQWKLQVFDGSGSRQTIFVVDTPLNIGRELDNDIPLDDLQVSRYHARIIREAEALTIEDLNSVNGTQVNNQPIFAPTSLQPGDTINLGSFTIEVLMTTGAVASTEKSRQKTKDSVLGPIATQPRRIWPWLLLVALLLVFLIIVFSALMLGRWLTRGSIAASATATVTPVAASIPEIVMNQTPGKNSEVPANHSVTIQVIASDLEGIERIELWSNGSLYDRVSSPLDQSAASMTGSFQWSSADPGDYALEVRAFNELQRMAVAPIGLVTVVGETPTPIPTPSPLPGSPSPTITPLPPTSTPTFTPEPVLPSPTATAIPASLQVTAPQLNVRSGPATEYDQIGTLKQGDQTVVFQRASGLNGDWWQIEFAAGYGGVGWVSGDSRFVAVQNAAAVPVVSVLPLPAEAAAVSTQPAATVSPTATATPFATASLTPVLNVTRAPDGQTLLIVENRSMANQPVRLTLSGGKSVGGGKELDPPPGSKIELVLEPDFYRALWSAPAKNFTRGVDFAAIAGKVIVMWIIPEEGVTLTEMYDELIDETAPVATPLPTATRLPDPPGLVAPPGKALLIISNLSILNEFGMMTITGGNYGGGQEFILNANTETRLELTPAYYRTVWHTPVNGGMSAGREFNVSAGEVILGWMVPEKKEVFMQFPGQPAEQINN